MAKSTVAYWDKAFERSAQVFRAVFRRRGLVFATIVFGLHVGSAGANDNGASTIGPTITATDRLGESSASNSTSPSKARSIVFTRPADRLTSKDIGLVINMADPYSLKVGEFYIQARKLSPEQVLRVELPVKAALSPEEFENLKTSIDARFNGSTQALALAWNMPYAVSCNSITGALALGFDPTLCSDIRTTCSPSRPSPYFNALSSRPYASFKMRLSMLLAAKDVSGAKSMIERGLASDHSLGLRGAPPTNAYFVVTSDRARSSRAPLFPASGALRGTGIVVHTEKAQTIEHVDRLLMYETGAAHVGKLDTLHWVPGALADHLTSFGGQLDGKSGQMSVLDWIASGATASYGTVSEPCSHPQKFPHPKVLLFHYAQGSTAIEAYWRSVAWPLQGVFVGEPLAAPFARR